MRGDQTIPGIGHNLPPEPISGDILPPEPVDVLISGDPKVLAERLARDYAKMIARFAELELGASQAPKVVDSDAAAQKIVNWMSHQVRPAIAEAKEFHTKEKAVYLACGREVDTFFLRRIDAVMLAAGTVHQRAEDYARVVAKAQREREREERRLAAAEAQRQQQEAARLAIEAQKKAPTDRPGANALQLQSQAAAEAARTAETIAAQPPAPVRIHGDYGAVAYLREEWDYEVTNPGEIPLRYLKPDDEAIREALAKGVRAIPGLEIFPRDKMITRRC